MILINNNTKAPYNENDTVYSPGTKQQVPIEIKKLKVFGMSEDDSFISYKAVDENAKLYSVMFWKSNCKGYPTNTRGFSDINMVYDEVANKVIVKEIEIGETYVFLGCEYLYNNHTQFAPQGGFYKSDEALQYSVPVNVSKLTEEILKMFSVIQNDKLRNVCMKAYRKYYSDFVEKPAAAKHHHNYIGGLLQHTYEVMNAAYAMSVVYNCNRDIVIVTSFFHDLMKIYEYDVSCQFLPYGKKKGHIVGSAEEFIKFALEEEVDSKLIDDIEHCILSHHRLMEWGSPVTPQSIEACIVHCADNASALINPIAIGFNQETNKDYYLRALNE